MFRYRLAVGLVAAMTLGFSALAEETTTTFSIDKMTCATCPFTVKKAIKRVKGVSAVTVDYKTKTATVQFDDTITDIETIANASTEIGFTATPNND